MIAWLKRVAAENSLATARVEEEAERQRGWTAAGFNGRCPAPFPPARPAGVTNPPPPPSSLTEGTAVQTGEAITDLRGTFAGGTLDVSSPAAIPATPLNGWEHVSRITRADAAPLRRRLALARDFDLDAHNIVWDADQRLLRGESIDLDHVASLIAEQVRKNLLFVYEPTSEGR